MKQSYWEKDTLFQNTDLLIVGTGIVGLSAALFSIQNNPALKITVVDAEPISKGASTRNAGFACFGSMSELLADVDSMGEEAMIQLVRQRWAGLQTLQSLVPAKEMNWKNWGGKEIFFHNDQQNLERVVDKIPVINKALLPIFQKPVFTISDNPNRDIHQSIGQVNNSFEGQLHPGKMINYLKNACLKKGIEVIGGLKVKNYETMSTGVLVSFANLIDKVFSKVLFATNGFSKRLFPDLEIVPARNLVMLTQPLEDLPIKGTYHYQEGYIYFRNVGNRLLLGGGRHWDKDAEETAAYGTNEKIRYRLLHFMKEQLLPQYEDINVEHEWSGILGVGPEKKPIVQMVSDRVGVAIRMGGMGVAIGSSIGKQASELMK